MRISRWYLRETIDRSGLTREQLAAKAGIEPGRVFKLIRNSGDPPTPGEKQRIAEALQVPQTILFGKHEK